MRLALAAVLLLARPLAAQIPDDDKKNSVLRGASASDFVRTMTIPRALAPVMARAVVAGSTASVAAVQHFDAGPSTATRAAVLQAARSLFVQVSFRLAPYDPTKRVEPRRYWSRGTEFGLEDKERDRAAINKWGARGASPGLVAAPLFDFELENLEGLAVVDSSGRRHDVRPWGVARAGELVWLEAPTLKDVPAPAFVPAVKFERGLRADAPAVRYNSPDQTPRIKVSDYWWPKPKETESEGAFFAGRAVAKAPGALEADFDLVFDSSGVWRGWVKGYEDEPVSPAAVQAGVMRWEELARRRKAAADSGRELVAVVRLSFRDASKSDGKPDESDSTRERQDACFPMTKRVVFCPQRLEPRLVRRLESAALRRGSRDEPARFLGAMTRGVAGYLIEAGSDLSPLAAAAEPAEGDLAFGVEPYVVEDVLSVYAYPERLRGTQAGYDGVERRLPRYLRAAGGYVAGLDGAPALIMVEEARHEAVAEKDRWRKPPPMLRLHPVAELARAFADPKAVIDPLLRPVGGARRAWLGLETQDMTPGLAKVLGVSAATRGGELGQLVNGVAPGSPAEAAGLKSGDVLVSLREDGKRQAVDLPGSRVDRYSLGIFDELEQRLSAVSLLERPRTNLDEALDDLLPGAGVTLGYLRGGRRLEAAVKLVEAPPDASTAPKLVDKPTGLILKELTPDVRRLLRLESGAPGLLVYDVESGSPAVVADLRPLSILVEIDGRPVSTLKDAEAALASARKSSSGAARVRSSFLGRPVVADLRVSP